MLSFNIVENHAIREVGFVSNWCVSEVLCTWDFSHFKWKLPPPPPKKTLIVPWTLILSKLIKIKMIVLPTHNHDGNTIYVGLPSFTCWT